MSTSFLVPPTRDSGQPAPTLVNRLQIRAASRERILASDSNGDILQGMPIPNGKLGDNAQALSEIQLAFSNISSNLGKLVPVERQHVVPPAIAAFVHLVFLILTHRPVGDYTSAIFFTVLLTSFAWPVWTTLKPMHYRLDEINVKMDVLQNSIESIELAVSRRPTVQYVPDLDIYPAFPGTAEEAPPPREMVRPISQPIEPEEAQKPIEQDKPSVNDERPEPFIISGTPEPEPAPPVPLDPIYRNTAQERTASGNPPAKPEVPGKPPVIADERDIILEPVILEPVTPEPVIPEPVTPEPVVPVEQHEQNVHIPDVSVPPVPPAPVTTIEQVIDISAQQTNPQSEPSFSHWSSTLFEIKEQIEPLASGTLQRLTWLNQREPVNLVSLPRIALRLLMYCASFSTADFASPNGFLGPPTSVSYYPTGDLEGDRNAAYTTALNCLDELVVLLPGSGKDVIAGALSELAQALNDLGLHDYASRVSGFALEILRDLYAVEPDRFRSRFVSLLSLRANIFVDLRRNDEAAEAAEEAVEILKEYGKAQTELVYAMLNYAVLLGSIGREDSAAAVAFELNGLFDDPTNIQPDLVLVSPLCQLCASNACIEIDADMALSEAEKAIEASRVSSDGNSKVVLAGALLTKSKILSFRGQNDHAYAISAEAVKLFRSASVDRHTFSLLLAHALFVHSHQLSEANRKGDSFTTIHETVELWQTLQFSAPIASKRPLAWALFELAKYRHKDADKQRLRNELQIAESAVSTFREVEPLDLAGLADALFLYADRMLELDKNREAATYAEESVQYFREAKDEKPKYALDLIFSLSLASSCLACTERCGDALEYAKQAVEVQHERGGAGEAQYDGHLRKLLMDVVFRATEMGQREDVGPWMQELQQLGEPENAPLLRRGGKPQPKNDTEFRKQTSYWMDAGNAAPKLGDGSAPSAGVLTPARALTPAPAPISAPQLDKGKGREVPPSTGPSVSPPRVDKGKARASTPENPFRPSSRLSQPEEILSPAAAAAAAQRRRDALAGMSPPRGGSMGIGNNNELLNSLLGGMGAPGGRTLGGDSGPIRPGNNDPLSGLFGGMGGMGGMMGGRPQGASSPPPPMSPNGRPLGSPIPQTARAPPPTGRPGGRMSGMGGLESLLGGLGGLGPGGGMGGGGFDPAMFSPEFFGPGGNKGKPAAGTGTETGGDETPRSGTWSGTGIQSKLSDDTYST